MDDHGLNSYRHGCRCDECMQANREHVAEWRAGFACCGSHPGCGCLADPDHARKLSRRSKGAMRARKRGQGNRPVTPQADSERARPARVTRKSARPVTRPVAEPAPRGPQEPPDGPAASPVEYGQGEPAETVSEPRRDVFLARCTCEDDWFIFQPDRDYECPNCGDILKVPDRKTMLNLGRDFGPFTVDELKERGFSFPPLWNPAPKPAPVAWPCPATPPKYILTSANNGKCEALVNREPPCPAYVGYNKEQWTFTIGGKPICKSHYDVLQPFYWQQMKYKLMGEWKVTPNPH